MPIASTPTSGPTAASLKDRLERLQRELAAQRASTSRATVFTLIIGVLLLGALCVYFYIGYKEITPLLEPDDLVNHAGAMIQQEFPGVRKQVEEELIKAAPGLAKSLSEGAKDSLPKARVMLEDYIIDQTEETVKEGSTATDEHFRKFLKEKKDLLGAKFKELATSPTLAEKSLEEIEVALVVELEGDIKSQMKEILQNIKGFQERLRKCASTKNLSEEEKLERRVWMLARRLQLEEVNPDLQNEVSPAPRPRPGKKPVKTATGKGPAETGKKATTPAKEEKKEDKKPSTPAKKDKKETKKEDKKTDK